MEQDNSKPKNKYADDLIGIGKGWKDTFKLIFHLPLFLKENGASNTEIFLKLGSALVVSIISLVGILFWIGIGVVAILIGLLVLALLTSLINAVISK